MHVGKGQSGSKVHLAKAWSNGSEILIQNFATVSLPSRRMLRYVKDKSSIQIELLSKTVRVGPK